MKIALFAAALTVCAASAGSALADRAVYPMSGTMSAVMMTNGDMKMTIKMPAAEMAAMKADMAKGDDVCRVQKAFPGAGNVMVLYCGQDELVAPGG